MCAYGKMYKIEKGILSLSLKSVRAGGCFPYTCCHRNSRLIFNLPLVDTELAMPGLHPAS
jgi:hypothetical protein